MFVIRESLILTQFLALLFYCIGNGFFNYDAFDVGGEPISETDGLFVVYFV